MPSIELVSVGQREPPILPELPFAVRCSRDLKSDRFPSPIFQTDFDALVGWIYHLGNPNFAKPDYQGLYFAYELLDRRYECTDKDWKLLFASEFQPGVKLLMKQLLDWSPLGQILFTTDWQFGPESNYRSESLAIDDFWRLHERGELRLNALYPIVT